MYLKAATPKRFCDYVQKNMTIYKKYWKNKQKDVDILCQKCYSFLNGVHRFIYSMYIKYKKEIDYEKDTIRFTDMCHSDIGRTA